MPGAKTGGDDTSTNTEDLRKEIDDLKAAQAAQGGDPGRQRCDAGSDAGGAPPPASSRGPSAS